MTTQTKNTTDSTEPSSEANQPTVPLTKNPNSKRVPGYKERGEAKVAKIPVKIIPTEQAMKKPDWIRVRLPANGEVERIKRLLREQRLHTVCEEAACPNLPECFGHGTATFMIMGDICTRRCPFCDVSHGRPKPLDREEPEHLAEAVENLGLRYVVITSVDRDDLKDRGAGHFVDCIQAVRARTPKTQIEVLVPDFRGRMELALEILQQAPPDVFNHNLESVPRLYRAIRPGSNYELSLSLLQQFKQANPTVPTKSGLMVGLGESFDEIVAVMEDLRAHQVDMITIGQYLQPSRFHLPIKRYVEPSEFAAYREIGDQLGFSHVASGPMVRSSYQADQQAKQAKVVPKL